MTIKALPASAEEKVTSTKTRALIYPFDRLPLHEGTSLFHRPHPESPYWTQRAKMQQENAIKVFGFEAVKHAALALYDSKKQFGRNPYGYRSVFEHNATCLAAGLSYQKVGLAVIDAHGRDNCNKATDPRGTGKLPRGREWPKEATIDPEKLLARFRGEGHYPPAPGKEPYKYASVRAARNICIVTGGPIMAFDFDGEAGLQWHREHKHLFPPTPMQVTGSGGLHVILRIPDGTVIRNSASAIAPGVDIRGEGGQIVAAPSLHRSGNFYRWIDGFAPNEIEIADIPPELIEIVLAASKKPPKRRILPATSYEPARTARAEGETKSGFEARCANIGHGEGQGGFDTTIYSASLSWFAQNRDPDDDSVLELKLRLRDVILSATCNNDDAVKRYATDSYLDNRISQAWQYWESLPLEEEATQDHQEELYSDTTLVKDHADQAPEIRSPRKLMDPLFEEKLVLNGFVKGEGKALDKNIKAVRSQMRASMSEMCSLVVLEGGDARAFMDAGPGIFPSVFKKEGLRDLFANRTVAYDFDGKTVKRLHPAEEFLVDPLRKTYLGTQFEPNKSKCSSDAYNLWTGFKVLPRQGDWGLLRGHIRDQIVAGNGSEGNSEDIIFSWVMTRYAHMFQFPGEKIGNAIVYKGGEGVGKSKLCDWMCKAVGAASLKIAQRRHLVGNFNGNLEARIYVVSEEAFFSGDKQAAGVVKDMVTSDRIEIERKGRETTTCANYIRTDFISNEDWVVPTGDNGDARRFLVLEVNDNRKQDTKFFASIDHQMENGGLEAMVYELSNWDPVAHGLTWGDLRSPPWTEQRAKQVSHGLAGPHARLKAIIEIGVLEGRTENGTPFYYELSDDEFTVVARPHLNAALTDKMKAHGGVSHAIQKAVATMLGDRAASGDNKSVVQYRASEAEGLVASSLRMRTVTFPPLSKLRAKLTKTYG